MMTEPISQSASAESSVATQRAAQALNGASPLPRAEWPSSDELIFDDGIPMETARHRQQMELLIETLELHWAGRQDFYTGGNMFVYFSPDQVKNEDFRGPDFYLALGVERRERKGWVVWEEGGKAPDLIIELLSESTADFDKKEKKEIYRTKLGAPEYYWFDPFSAEWAGFISDHGEYRPLTLDEHGRLLSPCAGLALVRWEGQYHEAWATWLRWETLDGQLLPTNAEYARQVENWARQTENRAALAENRAAQAENQAAQAENQAALAENRAAQAEAHAKLLAAKLLELGIDPESLK